jgi:hypothetical protein
MVLTYRRLGGQIFLAPYSTVNPTTGTYTDTSGSVVLNLSGPFTSYNLTRTNITAGNTTTNFTGLTNKTYTDTGLTANTNYSYQIVPISSIATGIPVNLGPTWTFANVTLAAPTINATNIVFTWSGNYSYLSISSSSGDVSANIPSGTTTWTDTGLNGVGLSGSTAYNYTITAYNGAGASGNNIWYNGSYLTIPLSLTTTAITSFTGISITNLLGGDTNTTYTTNGQTYAVCVLTRTDMSYNITYNSAAPSIMYVLAVGGGGGGAAWYAGGGGAGGVIINSYLLGSGSSSINVAVGAGGAGGTFDGNATYVPPNTGNNGADTRVYFASTSTTITAYGGYGGNPGNAGGQSGGNLNRNGNFGYGGGPQGPGGALGGGGGGAGSPYFTPIAGSYSLGGNGINCVLAPIANYTPTSKSILSSYYWGGGGGGGGNGAAGYENGGLGGSGGGGGGNAGTAGANGYNSGSAGAAINGGNAGANTGSGGGGATYGSNGNKGGNGGSGIVILAFPQLPQTFLLTNYNFASPVVSGSDTVLLNPTSILGWTFTGFGTGTTNLTNNTQGTTGTYGNFMLGTGSNGYTYPCPYGQCFLNQFYNLASNSFTLTSAAISLTARTYSVSFVASTRSIFNTAHTITVSLAGSSVSTSTKFTTSSFQYPWTPFVFTCTPASAGNYNLTITFSTSNSSDTTIGISQIMVI